MKWKRHVLRIAFLLSIISSFFAVAPDAAICADQVGTKKLASIDSVVTTGDGLATELVITLSSPAAYTSYKTTSPLRLVIDFSQVTQGNISAPQVINKGNFKSVTASRFDTDAGVLTRLEIELVSDSEALISTLPANPKELKISFPVSASSAPSALNKDLVDIPPVVTAPLTAPDMLPPPGVDTPLRTLTSISVNKNEITLAFDGVINNFKTFRLNRPERYVVDLMNVKSGLSTRLLPLNASGVASARIGLYPDKVRVVLDAVNGSFPEATAVKVASSLIIKLDLESVDENSNTKLASTNFEKSSDAEITSKTNMDLTHTAHAEVKPAVSPVTSLEVRPEAEQQSLPNKQSPKITNKSKAQLGVSIIDMIDFQVVDSISRVSVKVIGDINVDQPTKTPGYITLTLKNTTLPKKLQRSLETRAFVSPVLRITPLSVKTKKGTDTKLRIAIRAAAPYEYRREGDMLFIDFKHLEGLSGDKLIVDANNQNVPSARQKLTTAPDEEMSSDLSPVLDASSKPVGSSRYNYKGRKVTLEFADAEVRKIFQLLSEVSNKNFVLGDEVAGTISLKLVNVPWDQALDIILDTKGLDKRVDGNIIIIKGKGKFKTQAEEDLEIKKTAAKSIELKTETFSVNYADLGAISLQFEKLKTPDRGQISADSRTSKVIVKDTPQAISDMRTLLGQLDQPEKQVMIEARIVEASSTFSRNLGVNWGVHHRDGSAAFLGINALDSAFGGLTSAPPTSGVSETAGSSTSISFGTLGSNIKLDMRLNAAASAGLVKIVSTPKVATLNNKTAKITQGQSIPYTSSTSDKVETKFIEAALSLEVTPHINANGTISMKIEAKNDSPGAGGNPPPINKKQATTEMLLRDGETTVIGGIYVDSEQESDDGVPYLMDIPFLGGLFKTNNKSKTKTELLIFITPRILGTI
jgi:type IV pilus assembly protein PilQ